MRALHSALILLCGMATLTLMLLMVTLARSTPPETFRWVAREEAADGRAILRPVCEVAYLDRPIITLSTIGDFARTAVLQTNEFDYLNWPSELPRALRKYFAPGAARNFLGQFERSDLLRTVQANYYTVTAIPNGAPVVVETFTPPAPSLREWRVQVPVRILYQTGAHTQRGRETELSQSMVFEVQVADQPPTPTNFRGIAVIGLTIVSTADRR